MITLNVGDSLIAKLLEPATIQPDYYCSYIDSSDVPSNSKGVMSGVTEVTIVVTPTIDQRLIDLGTIFNNDTIEHTVVIMVANGVNRYTIEKETILPKESFLFGKQKFMIMGGQSTAMYEHIPKPSEINDFVISNGSVWLKKTLAETKAVLELGSAAYTNSSAYDISGTADSKIVASISDGDTTHAPDGNSVFDALALKAPLSGAALTSATINALTPTALTTGFTIAGGTTSKTLTVPLDASVSGTNTGDDATNSSSHYIGTTSVALNRASAALTLAGITLTTPDIGTPTAGTLTACTAATAADNTATTALASTAFAKSQDAVLARLPNQAVNMTAAASGSSGITVPYASGNIDFGTGNFTLVWRGSLPDWTPSSTKYLITKYLSDYGFFITVLTSGSFGINIIGATGTVSSGNISNPALLDGTTHELTFVVTRGASVVLYIDGVLFETKSISGETGGSINNSISLMFLGFNTQRESSTTSFAATYNRALTAAEVLDLYRNGINYADKWGSQTAKTSGTLVIGYKYRINTYVSDDDFTNIGTVSNASGIEFIATGTTPTHWAHSSSLVLLGATLALEPEGIQNDKWYDSSSNALNATYPTAGWSLTRKLNVPKVNTAQPAFLVVPAVDQTDIAITLVTVVWGTKIFDASNNFASNTFTAPITGKYLLSAVIQLLNVDSACGQLMVSISTSNRNYTNVFDFSKYSGDIAYLPCSICSIADMDAGDTATVWVYEVAGAQQIDIEADYSFFSGCLIC